MRFAPNHHIDKDLSETVSDILYRVKLENAESFISVLVEHQSIVDPIMPFLVLHYCFKIMKDYLKEHPNHDLPLVIPIVFYSGTSPYYETTDVFKLFGALELLARETLLQPFQLIDLNRIPDDEIRQHTWVSVMELVQNIFGLRIFF